MRQSLTILNFVFKNDVELFARTLQTLEPKTREQVVELKATLWALVSTPPPRASLHPLFPLSLYHSLSLSQHGPPPAFLSPFKTIPFTDRCYFFRDMSAPQTGVLTFLWRKQSFQRLFVWLRNVVILPFEGMTFRTTVSLLKNVTIH